MRIIIEGPDGGGKTKLAELLSEWFGLEIIRNDMGPEQDLEAWWPDTIQRTMFMPVIHDRFFYSELVYGPLLRGSVKAPAELVKEVQEGLRHNSLLIYARPERATLELGVRVEDQMKGVQEKFTELVEAYDRLMSVEQGYYGRRFYSYNWLGMEPQQVVKHVQRYLTGDLL